MLSCAMVLAWPFFLDAQDNRSATSIWKGAWEDPLLEKWVSCDGQVDIGSNGERTVMVLGYGWHEGGHDCHIALFDDSTGTAGFCPVFADDESGASRVGIRHVAGEPLLVLMDDEGKWLNWLGPEPAWRQGKPWPLFDLWRELTGEWEPVGDPVGHLFQVSGQRCEARLGAGWCRLSMVFGEYENPIRGAVEMEGQGVFRAAVDGDRLTLTRMKDVGGEVDIVMWEDTEDVQVYRRRTAATLAPFDGWPGNHPELSLSTVNRKQLDQPIDTLRWMRNEVFARHGWRFKSDDLRAHFEAQPWYAPVERNAQVSLTAVERFNVERIRAREAARRAALRMPVVFGDEWRSAGERGLQNPAMCSSGEDHLVLLRVEGACRLVSAPLDFSVVDEDMDAHEVFARGHQGEVLATFPGLSLSEGAVPSFEGPKYAEPGQTLRLGQDRFAFRGEAPASENAEGMEGRFLRLDEQDNPTGGHEAPFWSTGMVRFHWAGDLNDDGRTDVIISHKPKYSYAIIELWLSDPATGALQLTRRSDRVFGC